RVRVALQLTNHEAASREHEAHEAWDSTGCQELRELRARRMAFVVPTAKAAPQSGARVDSCVASGGSPCTSASTTSATASGWLSAIRCVLSGTSVQVP